MSNQEIKEILNYIKALVEANAIAAVKSMKAHEPTVKLKSNKVEFTNKLPEISKVKEVNPAPDYTNRLKEISNAVEINSTVTANKITKKLEQVEKSLKPPTEIKVTNLGDIKPPTKMEITNPQKTVAVNNLFEISKEVGKLRKSVEALKLNPTITVPDVIVPEITIPAIQVPETKVEIDLSRLEELFGVLGNDPKNPLAVRLSDGEEFYEAIFEGVAAGGSKNYAFTNAAGDRTYALVDADGHAQVDILTMPPISVEITGVEIDATGLNQELTQIQVRDFVEDVLIELQLKANLNETQPVSAASLPLPTGASTAALQTTGNTSLASLAGTVSGSELQVDIVSMPSITTDLTGDTSDLDTGAGSDPHDVVAIGLPASGGHVVGGTSTNPFRVDPTGTTTQPISVLSLPLPAGAATSAKQDTIIGHVDGIEALLTTIDADTSNLSVVGGGTEAAAIRVTIANDSTGVLSVDDNGGSLTIDGTVSVSGTVIVDGSGVTQPVSNAGLTELAAAINSNRVDVNIASSGIPFAGTEYTEDAAAAANPVGTALNLIRADSLSGLTTADGDNVAARGTDKGEIYVKHVDSIPVTGTFWQATQPISAASLPLPTGAATSALQGTGNTSLASIDTKVPALGQALAAASVPVVLTAAQLTTLTPPAAITGFATAANQTTIIGHLDGVEALLTTIDGDTDNISTKINTLAGAVAGTEMQVDVLTMPTVAVTGTFWQATQPVSLASVPSHPVTNAGTFAVQAASSGDVAHDAVDSGNPIKVGGKALTSTPTPVAHLDRTDAFFDEYGRQVVSDRDTELGITTGTTGLRDRMVAQRCTVLADSLADGIAGFWTQTTAGGGGIASTGGEGRLTTSTGATGSAQIISTNVAYYPGMVAWLNSAIRFGDAGTVGNIRRLGMYTVSGTTPQEGFYFELNGTTLNAVTVKAGVATAVASTSWTRFAHAPFTLDTNYHSFEIRYTANTVWFYVDNVLRHQVSGTSASLTTSLTLPIAVTNVKTSGATDITFAIRNIGNGRFGQNGGVVNETGLSAVEALAVGGGTPHDSVDSGSPQKMGGYASATAPTDVSANADRVNAWFLRNGAQATVLTAAGALIGGDATNGIDVDITRIIPGTAATNLGKAEDAAHASGDTGVAAWGVRNDGAATSFASANGDYTPIALDTAGRSYVTQKAPTATHSNVSGSASNVTLLAANTARLGATIFNDSTAILYVKLAATASTTSFATKLYPDDYFEVPFGYTGIIDGIWASATGAARVVETT